MSFRWELKLVMAAFIEFEANQVRDLEANRLETALHSWLRKPPSSVVQSAALLHKQKSQQFNPFSRGMFY